MNLKGGVGKTTTAMGLATAAERDGVKTRVLDADPQASATMWAYMAAQQGDPVPFSVEPTNRIAIKTMVDPADEAVIVDLPPSGDILDAARAAADMVVVPITPGVADWQQASQVIDALAANRTPYAVLVTMSEKGRVMQREIEAVIKRDGVSRLETEIPRREALRVTFYRAFGDELFGYDRAWAEIKAACAAGKAA